MNKKQLDTLILECIKEHQLKNALKQLVVESIQEIKAEKKLSCQEMMDELDSEVKKENKESSVTKDDAGYYNVCGCPPHMIKLKHMYEDRFNITYFKDGTDRTRKVSLPFEDVKKFVKEVLGKKTNNYLEKACNKIAGNNKDKETKSGDDVIKRVGEKAKDMVEKKDDLPDQPFKTVDSIKKQSEHSVKGKKQEYKYPKQKNNKLTVKLPEMKSRKSKKS
jgi:hypothetical protein